MSLRWTILAPLYDRMSRKSEAAGMGAMRESLLAKASGRVLEIGGGTGVNLRYYEGVDSLVVTEPEPAMLRRLHDRVRGQAPRAEIVQAPAEDLPFEDASFDTVVSTLVLCGVDQERSLGEVRRVLRPGGRLFFLEHVRSDDPGLARTMAALDRALARGQRWSGFLDDFCAVPAGLCRLRSRWRRRGEKPEEATAA